MRKAAVVKFHDKDDFEEYLEEYLNRGFRVISAGYTPDSYEAGQSGAIISTYKKSFWWAVMVKEE